MPLGLGVYGSALRHRRAFCVSLLLARTGRLLSAEFLSLGKILVAGELLRLRFCWHQLLLGALGRRPRVAACSPTCRVTLSSATCCFLRLALASVFFQPFCWMGLSFTHSVCLWSAAVLLCRCLCASLLLVPAVHSFWPVSCGRVLWLFVLLYVGAAVSCCWCF